VNALLDFTWNDIGKKAVIDFPTTLLDRNIVITEFDDCYYYYGNIGLLVQPNMPHDIHRMVK